jgi:hypothetical protein
LNEFAQESGGVGAVQISFTGKPGENFLTSFFEGVSCTKYYTGTVGGGSGVPTPSEWAMVFMSLVVFAGYGLCRERLTPAASAISRC